MNMNRSIKAGVALTDIRNFTGTFGKFQKDGVSDFKDVFISDFYDIQVRIAETISSNFWYNSLGDSMLFIFMDENYARSAYAFSMCVHKYLTRSCNNFNKKYDTNISFGVGVDSGEVWKMKIKNRDGSEHITYLGNTINTVERIETQTKTFAETEFLVGGHIYDELMQDLYTEEYSNARLFKTNYSEMLRNKPHLILMSENILLYFVQKLCLAGIEKPLPLFRYDNDLGLNDKYFWKVLQKLLNYQKNTDLKNLLKNKLK